jgi:two-component system response regulator RegX3
VGAGCGTCTGGAKVGLVACVTCVPESSVELDWLGVVAGVVAELGTVAGPGAGAAAAGRVDRPGAAWATATLATTAAPPEAAASTAVARPTRRRAATRGWSGFDAARSDIHPLFPLQCPIRYRTRQMFRQDPTPPSKAGHPGGVRLLLVEDDIGIAEPLVEGLEREGFAVDWVRTGAAALAAAPADVVLLDLGLPDIDGITVCHGLRARSSVVPILVVTARGAEVDRVVGLELGADDYIVKPFGFRELVARIRAVLRRSGSQAEATGTDQVRGAEVQEIGDLVVDRRARRVLVAGVEVALTPKEFDLLALLATDPGAVVERQQILEGVWSPHWYGPTKTLDVHVASLRRKLGHPQWVETVRRVGFRLGDTRAGTPATSGPR